MIICLGIVSAGVVASRAIFDDVDIVLNETSTVANDNITITTPITNPYNKFLFIPYFILQLYEYFSVMLQFYIEK